MKNPRILLVDDDNDDMFLTRKALESHNYEVVPATSVAEALKLITTQRFDVLITDLHMPDPGDGFAVVTAMRHSQPDVLNLVCSGYPDVQKSMAAILLQADEVLVKPFPAEQLAMLIEKGRPTSNKRFPPAAKESVAAILDRDTAITIARWLSRVEHVADLAAIPVTPKERTEYLPAMMSSVTARLRAPHNVEVMDCVCPAAEAHGQLRYNEGYTAPLIVQESRILQVSIFETIQRNLSTVDFASVLPDIMTIADEVDSQLKQAINSFLARGQGEVGLVSALDRNDQHPTPSRKPS